MANVYYANSASGPLAGAIAWFDMQGVNLTPGQNSLRTYTLGNGYTVSFTVTNTAPTGSGVNTVGASVPTSANAPFGVNNYTGIGGAVALKMGTIAAGVTGGLTLTNITVQDASSNPVTQYEIVAADAEATALDETLQLVTTGGNWNLLTTIAPIVPPATGPTVAGTGTATVSETGVATTGIAAPVFTTLAPTGVTVQATGSATYQAVAFGIVVTTITVQKDITNRLSLNDQFQLSIAGPQSSTNSTTGVTNGLQTNVATTWATPGSNYVINEAMAAGSSYLLSQYTQTVTYTNLTPGGTVFPPTGNLGDTVVPALGDQLVATITNTPKLPDVAVNKSPDAQYVEVGATVPFSFVVSNTGNADVDSATLTDVLPTQLQFVSGSILLNGTTPLTGDPNTGINIGAIPAGTSVTVSFNTNAISVPSTNPVINNGTINYVYNSIGTPPLTGNVTSNDVNVTIQLATLNLSKTVDKQYADVGEVLTYTILAKNTGNVDLNNVVVTDPIPVGTTYVPNSLTVRGLANSSNPATGIPVGTILVGDTAVISFKVVVGNTIPSPNPVINQATAVYTYTVNPASPNAKSGSAMTNAVSTLVQTANINQAGNTTKFANKQITAPGDTVTYTVTVTNTGNIPADNVVVKDVVPVGTTFVNGTVAIDGVPQPTQNPSYGVNVGTVNPGQTRVISFNVIVGQDAPAILTNTATTSYTYSPDPNLPPVTPTPAVTPPVEVEVRTPAVQMTKTANRTGAEVGDTITYTLSIQNTGQLIVQNFTVKDLLNANLQAANNVKLNGNPINGIITQGINIGTIGIGETAVVSFDATVMSKPVNTNKLITNTATGAYQYNANPNDPLLPGTTTSNPYNVTIYSPAMVVTKGADKASVMIGIPFVYTITVENTGDILLNNVILTDALPVGFEVQQITLQGSVITGDLSTGINIGNLPIDGLSTIAVTVIPTALVNTNEFNNQAIATGTALIDPAFLPVTVTATGTDQVGIMIYSPQLIVNKGADKSYAIDGTIVTYSISVTNEKDLVYNNIALDNVIVSDLLAEELEFIAGTVSVDGNPMPDANIITGINVGSLAIGQTKVVTFEAQVLSAATTPIINMSEGQFTFTLPGLPPEEREVSSNPYKLNVNTADLQVIKTVDKAEVMVGDTLTYTVEIDNIGNTTAYNVIYTDTLCKQAIIIPGTFKLNGKTINGVDLSKGITIGSIAPNQKTLITYSVTVLCDNCSGLIINEAMVTFTYRLTDGTTGTKQGTGGVNEANIAETQIALNTFKQESIESYLMIPEVKPDIETINTITNTIDIGYSNVIQTPTAMSEEGQKLTGHKIIIRGVLNVTVEYTALDLEQSVHSAYYTVPFSTFIILPPGYVTGSKLDITGLVEDVFYKQIDIRTFFINTTALINVKILSC